MLFLWCQLVMRRLWVSSCGDLLLAMCALGLKRCSLISDVEIHVHLPMCSGYSVGHGLWKPSKMISVVVGR